jgi:hypothetical protein
MRPQVLAHERIVEDVTRYVYGAELVLILIAEHSWQRRIHLDKATIRRRPKDTDCDSLYELLKALLALLEGMRKRVSLWNERQLVIGSQKRGRG